MAPPRDLDEIERKLEEASFVSAARMLGRRRWSDGNATQIRTASRWQGP